ncbi:hypothetical protein ACFPOU_08450 [Massilia jejuensis]|uniref:Recombination protein RecT n=1 Tax=Massilia jejuensis TaxID=648894 RepID=A0ABW0PES5_9BURK
MFDSTVTPAEYQYFTVSRAKLVRQLLVEALQDHVPPGYTLSTDPKLMYGNALLAMRPVNATPGTKMVCFMHAINYRSQREGDKIIYRLTLEEVRACGDVKGVTMWGSDKTFGTEGRIAVTSADAGHLAAMVRKVAAEVCASEPMTTFEWRRCAHDDGGKWELLSGERRLQTVWKSGSRYGTLMSTCPTSLGAAKSEAEAAARFTLNSEHQERLAGLGEPLAHTSADDEGEESDAPAM